MKRISTIFVKFRGAHRFGCFSMQITFPCGDFDEFFYGSKVSAGMPWAVACDLCSGRNLFSQYTHKHTYKLPVKANWKETLASGSGRNNVKELWVDKYMPRSLEELTVHKKKVSAFASHFHT